MKKTIRREKLLRVAIEAAIEAGKEILTVYGTDDFEIVTKEDQSPLTLADRKAHEKIMAYLTTTKIPVLSEEGKEIPWEERREWDIFWLVDPLDGTKEFIKRNGEFTVNIALIENCVPVLGVIYVPVTEVLYFGEKETGSFKAAGAATTWYDEHFVADSIPVGHEERPFTIVGSRSHMNEDTRQFIEENSKDVGSYEVISKGSSLKLCMVAEGAADLYPRFGPTMEWDTAAGHAIVLASGATITIADTGEPLLYNKESLLNPFFIVSREA